VAAAGEAAGDVAGLSGGGLLAGRRLLVTGVLTEASIAFTVARVAQQQGATVVLSGFGRGLSITRRVATRLPREASVVELDVTDESHLGALADRVSEHVDGLDGAVHAIAFAPEAAMGGHFLDAGWPDVSTAVQVSAYSLAALARAIRPLMSAGGALVGLDFDARLAWPAYDWMGVAKAGLESVARYLARDLGAAGIRVNLVSAGPLKTMAARSIPGFADLASVWGSRAPLGWDVDDAEPAARACCALLSGWFPATTGEIVHVDGGAHAMGA
jgi:enoyl-[acyl-carrier protein] reductase I